MKKDRSVADLALATCLKYWPKIDPFKEVEFINEVETLLVHSNILVDIGAQKLATQSLLVA